MKKTLWKTKRTGQWGQRAPFGLTFNKAKPVRPKKTKSISLARRKGKS